jgi:hypothetical protein
MSRSLRDPFDFTAATRDPDPLKHTRVRVLEILDQMVNRWMKQNAKLLMREK